MNIDSVIKRLEALEGKLTGTRHIESIVVGALGSDGEPTPCANPEIFLGRYVAKENIFQKINDVWGYYPNRIILDDFRDYCPPADYQNAVIYLIRCGEIEIKEAARQLVSEALKAAGETVTDDDCNQ